MTVHLIDYDDVAFLGSYMGYLRDLPERIEAFKIKLDLVPPAEYGKRQEPVLKDVVADAKAGSTAWAISAAQLRSLHQETLRTLNHLIKLMDGAPSADALKKASDDLQRHAHQFNQQHAACNHMVEGAARVIPRFMDFMKVRTFEFARRNALLIGTTDNKSPQTLNHVLTDEENLVSATLTIQWNSHYFRKALLSSANMGAYCSRIVYLLDATRQQLATLDTRQPTRRFRVSCQSTLSTASEAQRLIKHTINSILIYSI